MFRKFFLGAAAFVAAAGIAVGSTRSAALPPYSFDGAPATPAAYPEGATSAQIGLTSNYGGPCIAEGFNL